MNRKLCATCCIIFATSLFVSGTTHGYGFGEDWGFAKCSFKKKGKKHSVSYKHTGIDISASVGKSVVVNEHLKFVYKKEFSDGWRWGVVASTFDGKATYLFLHIDQVPNFNAGEDIYNKVIGKIADLSNRKANSHLHLGFRRSVFDRNLSLKGALPPKECTSDRKGLPSFREKFDPPNTSVVSIR